WVSADKTGYYRGLLFQLLPLLQGKGRFAELREVWGDLARLDRGVFDTSAEGPLFNPGFEKPPPCDKYPWLASPPTGLDWTIRHHPEVVARRDGVERHGGAYSLRLSFNAAMRSDFQNVSQLIVVEPSREYRLSYFVKTKQIPDDAPFLEITDAVDPATLSLKSPVPRGTTGWAEQAVTFVTPEKTRA